jgi:hypothetical protein
MAFLWEPPKHCQRRLQWEWTTQPLASWHSNQRQVPRLPPKMDWCNWERQGQRQRRRRALQPLEQEQEPARATATAKQTQEQIQEDSVLARTSSHNAAETFSETLSNLTAS